MDISRAFGGLAFDRLAFGGLAFGSLAFDGLGFGSLALVGTPVVFWYGRRSGYQDSTGELFRFLEQKLPNFWCYSKMYVPGCFSRFSRRLYPKPNII